MSWPYEATRQINVTIIVIYMVGVTVHGDSTITVFKLSVSVTVNASAVSDVLERMWLRTVPATSAQLRVLTCSNCAGLSHTPRSCPWAKGKTLSLDDQAVESFFLDEDFEDTFSTFKKDSFHNSQTLAESPYSPTN